MKYPSTNPSAIKYDFDASTARSKAKRVRDTTRSRRIFESQERFATRDRDLKKAKRPTGELVHIVIGDDTAQFQNRRVGLLRIEDALVHSQFDSERLSNPFEQRFPVFLLELNEAVREVFVETAH